MPSKFRLFGGPNGSGKTYLFEKLRRSGTIHTELYINADRILRDLKERGNFNFNAYRVSSSESELRDYIFNSGLFVRLKDPLFLDKLHLKGGVLTFDLHKDELGAYHASFIASYLATRLFETGQSFCFETVMSHEGKLEFFDLAKQYHYKSYLYFVFTNNPELNVARVKLRAAGGLHDVDANKIRERYDRTFQLLPTALSKVDEAYIIDNSESTIVVAEKRNKRYSLNNSVDLSEEVTNIITPLL